MKSLLGLGLFSFALLACGPQPAPRDSEIKITNGTIIDDAELPAVVNIFRRILDKNGNYKGGATCTATWISEDTLLTAAHCLGDEPSDADGRMPGLELVVFEITDHDVLPKSTRGVVAITEAYRNKLWEKSKGFNRYDLAILKAPARRPGEKERSPMALSTRNPEKGDAVELVGFGYNNMSFFGKSGDDRKRKGTNVIAGLQGGFIEIVGESKDKSSGATGENVSAGQGDSGGPLLRSGEVIGVASGGGQGGLFGRGEASFVDLSSEDSKNFLQRFGF